MTTPILRDFSPPGEGARAEVLLLLERRDVAEGKESVQLVLSALTTANEMFRTSPYGRKVSYELNVDGITNLPFGNTEEHARDLGVHVRGAADQHMLGSVPHRERKQIKNQLRYILGVEYLGAGTQSAMDLAGKAISAVLAAVVDGGSAGVDVSMKTIIANAMLVGWQVWHRDDKAHLVVPRTSKSRADGLGKQRASSVRPDAYTFAAVVAFEDDTVIDVVRGSHLLACLPNGKSNFNFEASKATTHGVPTGCSGVFNCLLVHRGMRSKGTHVRGHMYASVHGCSLPAFGSFEPVTGPVSVD